MITLTILKNPFNTNDREIKSFAYVRGKTIEQYAMPSVMGLDDEIIYSLNGKIVDGGVVPDCGDYIALCPVVKGGGFGKIFRFVAQIALMVYAPQLAANWGLGAVGTIGNALGSMAIMYVGGLLINAIAPLPKADTGYSTSDTTTTSTYSWSKASSATNQGGALAITYGTMLTAGTVLSRHVTADGDNQYLNILLTGGQGPIDSISDIRINDNPIENFNNVTVETRLGLNGQEPISLFGNMSYSDQALAYELDKNGTWMTATTEGNSGEGLEITLEFPQGLYYINDDNSCGSTSVNVQMQYRLVGTETWQNFSTETVTISSSKNSSFAKMFRKDNIPAGRYDVRCRCSSKAGTTSRYANRINWTQLSHIIYGEFCRQGKVLVAIKALATSQLSGSVDVTWKQTVSKVNVFNPYTNAYEEKPATNPAWASYDIVHRCRKLKNIHTGNFEYIVDNVKAGKILYSDFEAWSKRCDDLGLSFNYIFSGSTDLWNALKVPEVFGRGKVILRGTRFSCVYDKPSTPVQLFTMGNINKETFSTEYLSITDRANAIEVSFLNKEKNYQKDVITIYADEYDEDTLNKNPTQVTLDGCVDYKQAYIYGKYALRLNKYMLRTVTFTVDIDGIACAMGDQIMVQHDVPQWGYGGRVLESKNVTLNNVTTSAITLDQEVTMNPGKNYQILLRITNPNAATPEEAEVLVFKDVAPVDVVTTTDTVVLKNILDIGPQRYDVYSFGEIDKVAKPFVVNTVDRKDDLFAEITAVEYIKELYEGVDDIPVIDYSDLNVTFSGVTNLQAVEESYVQRDSTVISVIHVSWRLPRGQYAEKYEVWYSKDGKNTWNYVNQINALEYTLNGAKTNETYYFKVIALSGATRSKEVISNGVFITGKDNPPPDVTKVYVAQNGDNLTFSVEPVNAPDIRYYVLKYGSTWDNSVEMGKLTDVLTITAPKEGTLTFLVKAVDNSYNESVNACPVSINVSNLTEKNIVYAFESNPLLWIGKYMKYAEGAWRIKNSKVIGDYHPMSTMFGAKDLCEGSYVDLPVIDLGVDCISEGTFDILSDGTRVLSSVETVGDYEYFADMFATALTLYPVKFATDLFLSVTPKYVKQDKNRVDVYVSVSTDGYVYSDFCQVISRTQIYGRYIRIRLVPISVDGVTNVDLNGCLVQIDVPDKEVILRNVPISAGVYTKVAFGRTFMIAPTGGYGDIFPFVKDANGNLCSYDIRNVTTKDFEIALIASDNSMVAGTLTNVIIRGY